LVLCNRESIGEITKIIIDETQGPERGSNIEPLLIEDLGDMWFIRGSPYENAILGTRFNIFYMHALKEDCEILDVGSQTRPILTRDEENMIRRNMTQEQFDIVFGEPKNFDIDDAILPLYAASSGGIINSAANAIRFANVIIRANAPESPVLGLPLLAREVGGVWHIHAASPLKSAGPLREDILVFKRNNAKILAFKT
jgi:hypothetical protein